MAASSSAESYKCDLCYKAPHQEMSHSSSSNEISTICSCCQEILKNNFKVTSERHLGEYEFSIQTECSPKTAQEAEIIHQFNQAIKQIDPFKTQEEIEKGIAILTALAEERFVPAQYFLGVLFNLGEMVNRDIGKSTRFYNLAADAGNLEARRELGDLYYRGIDGQRDVEEAIRHYSIAAEEGDPISQFNLGAIYLNGIDLPQDPVRAFAYMEKAANQNFTKAIYHLAIMYLRGMGISKNTARGLELLRSAADQNQGDAQAMLAALYCQGEALLQNESEANRWFRLSGRRPGPLLLIDSNTHEKDESNFFTQGHFYHHVNKPRDIELALKFYRRAAATGHVTALYRLAEIYMNGDGVPINRREAERYYEMLRQRGHSLPLKVRIKLQLHSGCSIL